MYLLLLLFNYYYYYYQGHQTRPNSGGGVEEVTKIDATIPGSIFKKLHLLPYIRKAIKKGLILR